MSTIKFNRAEEMTEEFIAELTAMMPTDMKVISFNGEDPTGMADFWENYNSRHFKNLCFFNAIGGILPSALIEAIDNGNVYTFEGGYEWCGEEGLAIPEFDNSIKHKLDEILVICDRSKVKSKDKKILLAALEEQGLKVLSLNDIYAMKIAEAIVEKQDFITYLENIGAKLVNGVWTIKFKKYTQILLEFDKETNLWSFHEGTQKLELRSFYGVNNKPMYACPHKIALLVLNFLITSFDEQDLKGRKAYMGGVFTDITSVGFEHKLLHHFKNHKVGMLLVGCKTNNFLPQLIQGGNMIQLAKAYEALGFSVFMHKGAKYIVVEAEMTGFARNNGKTQVAWAADKAAKLTGRALWNVPTAAEYVDDDDD